MAVGLQKPKNIANGYNWLQKGAIRHDTLQNLSLPSSRPTDAPEPTPGPNPTMKKNTANNTKGILIAIEGIDGAGKTTQVEMLCDWLRQTGREVIVTNWYRTRYIYDLNMKLNLLGEMNCKTAILLVAAEFAGRLEHVIAPALEQGCVVIADKYIYTPFAKDAVRGIDRALVRKIYEFAAPADLAFYLKTPVEEALRRIVGTRKLNYWECGMDLFLGVPVAEGLRMAYGDAIDRRTLEEGFKKFQSQVSDEYDNMLSRDGMVEIDGTLPASRQHETIRAHVERSLGIQS